MKPELDEWQARLGENFARLQAARSSSGTGRPLFALEHGLNPSERDALATAIRRHILHEVPSSRHALAWIVYSAEVGYRYSGDEYWQTFEVETPGWGLHGNRSWIRDRYQWFHKEYGGAEPSGRWAEWFTIICWPIAHAILPRDLQRQLARVLYDIRHSYSAELFENPDALGALVAGRSWNRGSRFRNLVQDTSLLGQIAAALLLQGKFGTECLIHPDALQRITKDLDRERRGRDWLRGARRAAEERVRVRSVPFRRRPSLPAEPRANEARATALGIEPRLVLRPTDLALRTWEVLLEIPDLSHLLVRFPRLAEVLPQSRCVVAGAAGRPLARGRCLHGVQRITLAKWPQPEEVLFQFERADPQLEYLLRTECLLRSGPSWLFRIASDGLGYQLRSVGVRPGQRYIVVTANDLPGSNANVQPIDVLCAGVHGWLLDLPPALSAEWERALQHLGLEQAKTVEVWPAGFAAKLWDGEGHGEWLASEHPTLAIQSDHTLEGVVLTLNDSVEPSLEVTPIIPGQPIFVELPQMPAGLHRVRVAVRQDAEAETEALADLDILMRVREAQPWMQGVAPYGPLAIHVEPPTPTLEQLWEGHVAIEVRGPPGRDVSCTAALFETADAEPTVHERLPSLSFPLSPEEWRAAFERHFRENRRAQDGYDDARVCRLEFSAEELGAFTLDCEREFVPLRWSLRQRGGAVVARLIDDSGEADLAQVSHFTFDEPAVAVPLAPASEYPISAPGGLYLARQQNFTATVIALPPRIRRLADLGGTVQIDDRACSVEAILDAIKIGQLWGSARSSGDVLSLSKRRSVLHAIIRHILMLIGGEQWALAEREAEDGIDRRLSQLKRAVSHRPDQVGVAAALSLEIAELAAANLQARVSRLSDLAISFRLLPRHTSPQALIDSPMWLAEFALRLASSPTDTAVWAKPQLRTAVTKLVEVPTLARAARFMVMVTDRHLQSLTAPGELYASWGWREAA